MEQIDFLMAEEEARFTPCKKCKEFCEDYDECVKYQAGLIKAGKDEEGEQQWIGSKEQWAKTTSVLEQESNEEEMLLEAQRLTAQRD